MIWFGLVWFWLVALALVIVAAVFFRRRRHRDSDTESPSEHTQSPAQQKVLDIIQDMHSSLKDLHGRARVVALRRYMDSLSDGQMFASEFRATAGSAPAGEWVIAPGALRTRRILYIHGGSWIAGSPKSHRAITDRLSRLTHACVFAIDYRLMPEHRYMDGVIDCRKAYQWLLQNGPDGPESADFLVISGDSAGGSHTLGLIAWIRDRGIPQPDAAVALSPSTELMLTSLASRSNINTDPMLGPTVKKMARFPPPLLWWGTTLGLRMPPTSPLVSPLRGNLDSLPPTLIHVSESEILLDNARRYAMKAQAAGSPVELETWPEMVHVWHLFTPLLPEAEEAFEHIGAFLGRVEAKSPAARI